MGYLAIKLVMKTQEDNILLKFKTMNRFVVLPSEDEKQYIILIDDVIRHNLKVF
jgi:polyphosphate kinase